jgi:hypothetical protein
MHSLFNVSQQLLGINCIRLCQADEFMAFVPAADCQWWKNP